MTRKSHLVSFAVLALVAGACGGGGAAAPTPRAAPTSAAPATSAPAVTVPGASCKPSGTKLVVAAKGIAFNKACLAVPANTAFTIEFQNKTKDVPHNVSIKSADLVNVLFKGDVVTGVKTIDYDVKALPAGTYVFNCDIHPQLMQGAFVVS